MKQESKQFLILVMMTLFLLLVLFFVSVVMWSEGHEAGYNEAKEDVLEMSETENVNECCWVVIYRDKDNRLKLVTNKAGAGFNEKAGAEKVALITCPFEWQAVKINW